MCSNVEIIHSWTCHVYEPFEFRTSLGTSICFIWVHTTCTFKYLNFVWFSLFCNIKNNVAFNVWLKFQVRIEHKFIITINILTVNTLFYPPKNPLMNHTYNLLIETERITSYNHIVSDLGKTSKAAHLVHSIAELSVSLLYETTRVYK